MLIYAAQARYGGWVSFTAHLAKVLKQPVYKITNKRLNHRPFALGVNALGLPLGALSALSKPLILTAVEKGAVNVLEACRGNYWVIHDPTECDPIRRAYLPDYKIITIRKSVASYLKSEYGIDSIYLPHPYTEKPITRSDDKQGAVSISRVDFDKHIDWIIEANHRGANISIYGYVNRVYAYHKLGQIFDGYYFGRFDNPLHILASRRFLVDMSLIKNDGGGTQYTFLEGIAARCCLILQRAWVAGHDSPFIDGYNCLLADSPIHLCELLKAENWQQITNNALSLLANHDGHQWVDFMKEIAI